MRNLRKGRQFFRNRRKQASWQAHLMGRLLPSAVAVSLLNIGATAAAQELSRPTLQFMDYEQYHAGEKDWVRYRLEVVNKGEYGSALFMPAPDLPPCGSNINSSRTWVDIFANDGSRIYGFCALGKAEDLGSLWFATEAGEEPPRWVYIEIHDRKTGLKQRSNLAIIP